jgi:hypothetical protein
MKSLGLFEIYTLRTVDCNPWIFEIFTPEFSTHEDYLPDNLLSNEDFPNVISQQVAKISYPTHCKVFQQVYLIVLEAKIK